MDKIKISFKVFDIISFIIYNLLINMQNKNKKIGDYLIEGFLGRG